MVPPAIQVRELARTFLEARAVDNITFDVSPGELFGLLGPNGAGKTTAIRILTGQLRPTSGCATVCGYDVVTERAALKPCIGVVFEHQNVYGRMTVLENLRFSARLYGVDDQRVQQMLLQIGLGGESRKKAADLSNGMRQRLLIARALLHHPRVLFLDEPTKGLDPGVARDIRNIVAGLRDQGVTVFLTTHYMEEADRLCDRAAIIERGQIIAMDTPEHLKQSLSLEKATLEDAFLAITGHGAKEVAG